MALSLLAGTYYHCKEVGEAHIAPCAYWLIVTLVRELTRKNHRKFEYYFKACVSLICLNSSSSSESG